MKRNKVKIGGVNFDHIKLAGDLHVLIPPDIKSKKEMIEKVIEVLVSKCCCSRMIELENFKNALKHCDKNDLICTGDAYTHLIPYASCYLKEWRN